MQREIASKTSSQYRSYIERVVIYGDISVDSCGNTSDSVGNVLS